MKKLFLIGWLLAVVCCLTASADSKITASLTFTNGAGTTNGQTITVNGDARTWTNNVALPLSQILTNSTATGAKTNFYRAIGSAAFAQVSIVDRGATNVDLVGASGLAMTVTLSAGWGSVTYSTQSVAGLIPVRAPISGEPSGAQQTNIASLLAKDLDTLSTNAFHESSPIAANLVGITNAQTVTGAKIFSSFSGTAGAITNAKLSNATATNLINYGLAIRSYGATGLASQQFGLSAAATNDFALAVGSTAAAWGSSSTALGTASSARADNSTAVGTASFASATSSTALGDTAAATAPFATALGASTAIAATHTNSTAIGFGATTTAKNQVMLGSSGISTVVNQDLSVGSGATFGNGITNLFLTGTNNFPAGADIAFGRYSLSSLANGNNAAIAVGTNVFVEVGGPSSAFTINGIAGGRDGKLLFIVNLTGQNMTIAHDSGVDPTAANRIYCMTGADRSTTGNGVAALIYNANVSRWILWQLDP